MDKQMTMSALSDELAQVRTKKKEFLAIPVPYTGPAFQLFINGRFHKTYFFKDKKWKEL